MSKVEFDELTTPYEFEDRAKFFIQEVEKLAEHYRSTHIEVENTTLERMDDLGKRIKQLEKNGKDKNLLKKLEEMEYGFQIQSADRNRVIVTVYSHTSRPLTPFEIKVDAIAKACRGIKSRDESDVFDFGDDPSEENFRFVACLIYDFKNDL